MKNIFSCRYQLFDSNSAEYKLSNLNCVYYVLLLRDCKDLAFLALTFVIQLSCLCDTAKPVCIVATAISADSLLVF